MVRAKVIGHAISTAKHPTMQGRRLMLVQPLSISNGPDGDPLMVVDTLGAAIGQVVVLTSDGKSARELVGSNQTPIRYYTMAIED